MVKAPQQTKQVRIGNYVLTGKIGQGGVAEIYKARQESLGRDVAIKVLSSKLSNDPDIVRRFERESMVIAKLNHPNIVHVIDKGKAAERYYFVMEYIDGTSLREVIDADRIPVRTKLEMVAQVCKALDYAHKNGVIHRDIKPTNILIDRQGNPRVADFGIAQIVGTPDWEMTSSDVIMGTLAYMSPEQRVSTTNVDHTTDIYAIGVIIYEILLGRKPLGHFKLPSEIDNKTDPAFDEIVSKCLATEAKDRYRSAVELKNAILNAIGGGDREERVDDFAAEAPDSFIGKCRYLDTIKETRFGSTILVENRVNKQLYVIKKHERGEAGRKEAKLLTSLKHKNIINILGSGGDNRSTVIISEYAQGGSLAERMVRRYDWEKAMMIVLDFAAGLDFAHKNNIIHGNLRPSNILFTADNTIKLTDFGLPSHYDASSKKNWYSPPEHKQSRQGDIYAVGVILHQLITGRNPEYDADDNLLLDDIKNRLPQEVAFILGKLLAIRVSRRYKTCEQMILDWEEFDQLRHQAEAKVIPHTLPPVPDRGRLPASLLAAIIVGAMAMIAFLLYFSGLFD